LLPHDDENAEKAESANAIAPIAIGDAVVLPQRMRSNVPAEHGGSTRRRDAPETMCAVQVLNAVQKTNVRILNGDGETPRKMALCVLADGLLRGSHHPEVVMFSKARLAALLVISAGSIACAAQSGDPTPSSTGGGAASEADKSMTVSQSEGKITGTWVHEADTVSFDAALVSGNTYAVTVKARGLTLDATIDPSTGSASFDGFATTNGGDTQLTKQDMPVLAAFAKAVDAHFANAVKAGDKTAAVLSHSAQAWGEWPSTMTLQRRVLGEEGRSYTSICGYIGQIYNTTHDCCTHWYDPCTEHDMWSSGSSVHSYIGDYGTGTTWVWSNGWQSWSVDHWNWPYEYGDCFARCGADCGGGTQYTVDCGNHDNCVRNGHWIGSPYCDDQFADTLDDALYAPNCY
jgi:hypothetical protein